MRLNFKLFLVLLVAGIAGSASCTKDKLRHEALDPEQLVTTDASGNPSQFLAQNCPIIFGNAGTGTWTITGTQDSALVNVAGVEPLDEFSVKVTGSTLTLSFYMGWENTDTQATGKGDFQVTLTRQ